MFKWLKSKFNSSSNDILLKGKYSYDEEKYDEALKLFDDYLTSKPQDCEGWYWKAITSKHKHPNEWYNKYNCSSNHYKDVFLEFKNAFGFGFYYDEIKQDYYSLNKHIIYRRFLDKVDIEPLFCDEFSLIHKYNTIKIQTKTINNKEYPSINIGPFYDVLVNICPSFIFIISYCPWCREHLSKNIKIKIIIFYIVVIESKL